MKKILVILTGGTIGSKVEGKIINTTAASSYRLLQLYNEKYADDTEFEVIQPINILSENLTPVEWGVLCNCLLELNFEKYQGIIITHGSDTLSYTSALIGTMFENCSIPIVLVASNLALGLPGSNGMNNFRNAVCFIKSSGINGVFTIFENNKGEIPVYLSTHIVESDPFTDQFRSFIGKYFGKMIDERFFANESYPHLSESHKLNISFKNAPDFNNICNNSEHCKTTDAHSALWSGNFNNGILLIRPYPGLKYGNIDLSAKPKAVLHYMYHSATACTTDSYSIIDFAKKCIDLGIDFYCASFKSKDAALYDSSAKIIDTGVTPLYNISCEAAYAKLMILYNCG